MTQKQSNPKDSCGIRKVPFHNIPVPVLAELGLAMLEGARKYGSHNYRAIGVRASTYIDAVFRHLNLQFWEGEDIDTDSGVHHVTKAIACLVVLRDSMLQGNWIDDRPIRYENKVEELNTKAGEIIDKYPNCVPPYLEKPE